MEIEVVRSVRRRKTVQARQVDGVLRVSIPATMTTAEEQRWVGEFQRRFERHQRTVGVDLEQRAIAVAARYDLPRPTTVRWVDNQHGRWGSCTPAAGTIRISSRLSEFPAWVLDYVLVHELAHLQRAWHDPEFWRLVARYPKMERARGYLMAKGVEGGD